MRLKSIFFKSLLGFIAIALILLLSLSFLISTQSGLRLISSLALPYVPELNINQINGRLIGPIEIKSLTYKTKEIEFEIDNAVIDWRPSDLRLSTFTLEKLIASKISFKQIAEPKVSDEAKPEPKSIDDIVKQLKLPISINLKNIEISAISIDADYYKKHNHPDKNQPIIVDTINLSLQGDSQKIVIPNLLMESNIAKVKGDIRLGLNKKVDTGGNLSWSFQPQNLKSINGETQLEGNTNALTINTQVMAPYSSDINLAINDLLRTPKAVATITIKQVDTAKINSDWPNYLFDGNINLEGDIDAANINSQLLVIAPLVNANNPQNIDINTQARWANNQLELNINTVAESLVEALTIRGLIKPELLASSSEEAINLNLKWKSINQSATAENFNNKNKTIHVESPSGELNVSGNLSTFRFNLNSIIKTGNEKNQQGDILLSGQGGQEAISVNAIQLTGPIGTINGNAEIKLKPELNVIAKLNGKELNPEVFSSEWPGKLSLDLNINTVKNTSNKTQILTDIISNGKLRGLPFSLSANASYDEDNIKLSELNLVSNKSTLSASIEIKNNSLIDAQWQLDSKNIGDFIPDAQGQVLSSGNIFSMPININNLSYVTPKIVAKLTGKSIAIDSMNIDSIDTNFDIDWTNSSSTHSSLANIKISDASINSSQIKLLDLTLTGTPKNHQLSSQAKTNYGDIELALNGKLNEINNKLQWLFTLDDVALLPAYLNPWRLSKKAKGIVNATEQEINQFCWTSLNEDSSKAEICLNLSKDKQATEFIFSVDNLPTEYFSPLKPENLTWTSSLLKGEGKIALSHQGKINADIELSSTQGNFNWQQKTNSDNQNSTKALADKTIIIEPGSIVVKTKNNQIKANLRLPIEQKNGINVSFNIDNSPSAVTQPFSERSINGAIDFKLNTLTPLVNFIPDAAELEGSLNTDWAITGSLNDIQLQGKLVLENAKVALLTPGITLENINLQAQSNRNNNINYTASATSGGGSVQSNGSVLMSSIGPKINARISGNDFLVANTPEAVVYASPDLTLTSTDNVSFIEGSLTIPKASITPKTLPASVLTTSGDEIIIDSSQASTQTNSQNISASIQLNLGDDVSIDGFGFKGRSQGNIAINKSVNGPTLGNGRINIIDGEYRAFGQGLVIEKGAIIFSNGPITKPGIDIKALRRPADGITVGVFARGSVSQPKLTIFSEPPMTQSEQLSWLVLGRSLEQSSEGESNALNQLLLSLTLSRGDSFLNNIGDAFSLDTLSIKTGSGEAGAASDNNLAELVLGKYLTPDLYVSYGIGLFKPINVFSLEYSLSKHWKLISENSSESSSGDLIYTIER